MTEVVGMGFLLVWWACFCCQDKAQGIAVQQSKKISILTGATLIDGTGSVPLTGAVVVIEGNRIRAIGPASELALPEGARHYDLSGKWIIPGLIDAHVHFLESGSSFTRPDFFDMRAVVPYDREIAFIQDRIGFTLTRYTCSGVTSVVSLGGPMWEFEVRALAKRLPGAPRVALAGPLLGYTIEKGVQGLWQEDDPGILSIESPALARTWVRRLHDRGVDLIKTGFFELNASSLEGYLPVLAAIVDEAHDLDLRVASHTWTLASAKAAVRAGVDVLAHVFIEPLDDELLDLILARDVITVSTLAPLRGYADVLRGTKTLLPIERDCGDGAVIHSWQELQLLPASQRPAIPDLVLQVDQLESLMLDNVRRLHRAGARVAAGSDAGNVGALHGPGLIRELLLMKKAGIPNMDILVAATRIAAAVADDHPQNGTLQAGKLADLVILKGDPIADIAHVALIERVMVDGGWVGE